MSRLDELITALCPNGVPYFELSDIFDLRNGYTPSKSQSEFWKDGDIPWFRMEDIRENGRILSDSIQHITSDAVKGNLFPANSIIVATSATIGEHALITTESLANQRFTALIRKKEFISRLDPMFAYYYCFKLDEWCLNNLNMSSFASVDMKNFRKFPFPLPPISVQEEIVRILDNFTELSNELSNELSARKKQYEYYRDELLKFEEAGTHWVKLGEVADITKLAGFEFTNHIQYSNEGRIIALRGLNVKNGYLDLSQVKYIDGSDFSKLSRSKLYINDMLFTYVGTVGQVALIDKDDNYYLAPNVSRIRFLRQDINPIFMRYYFQTSTFFRTQINKYMESSSLKNLTMENIRKFKVPIPSIDEQDRIVAVLDQFDALCNDLTNGLPAEIEARRKQYEYYRDKLLTFQEA